MCCSAYWFRYFGNPDLDPSVGLGVDMTASQTRGLVLVQRDQP
jgi:hypothetical protein